MSARLLSILIDENYFFGLYCPFCGEPVSEAEMGQFCEHLRFIYEPESGELIYSRGNLYERFDEVRQRAEADGTSWDAVETACTLLDDRSGVCIELVAERMACGPYTEASYYGLDMFGSLDDDDDDDDEIEPAASEQ